MRKEKVWGKMASNLSNIRKNIVMIWLLNIMEIGFFLSQKVEIVEITEQVDCSPNLAENCEECRSNKNE